MHSDLTSHILRVCTILNKHAVDYMIVGGVSVGLHGYFRKSIAPDGKPAEKLDLDIWYRPTYQNYFSLLDALEELGLSVADLRNEKAPNPRKSFFKFDLANFTLDFLPSLKSNLGFNASFKKRELFILNKIDVP